MKDGINLYDDLKFNNHVDFDKEKADIADVIESRVRELAGLINTLPNSFSGTLDQLIKWRKATTEKLAEDSLLSPKTIQRMRNDEGQDSKLRTIIAICIGLKLQPELSYDLISKSGYSLKTTVELHLTYSFLLRECYFYSIETCNEILVRLNYKPLGMDE